MIQMDHLIPAGTPNQALINKKKRTCHQQDFHVPMDPSMKIKDRKIINKYQDLARVQKQRCGI